MKSIKKIMFAAAVVAVAGMTSVNAETVKVPTSASIVMNVQDKTPVKAEDLPDAVKTTLAGDDYSGWDVKEAFSVSRAGGVSSYEISLQKGDENKVVNLNEAGQIADQSSDVSPATPMEEPTSTTPIEEPTQTTPTEIPTQQ